MPREVPGTRGQLMMGRNQVWGTSGGHREHQAPGRVRSLNGWKKPTSPDDVLPRAIEKASRDRVATGKNCQNRVIFKQLLQAKAIGCGARSRAAPSAAFKRGARRADDGREVGVTVARTPAASGCASKADTSRRDYIAVSGRWRTACSRRRPSPRALRDTGHDQGGGRYMRL